GVQDSRRLSFGFPNSILPGYTDHPDVGRGTLVRHLIHERVHNVGIGHSSGLDCGASAVLFPCEKIDTYANLFDVMGQGQSAFTLNADQMHKHNLRSESNYLHISQSGTYEIDAITSKNLNAKIAAYIHSEFAPNQREVFMVESRK